METNDRKCGIKTLAASQEYRMVLTLGIDVGTGSTKAILYDHELKQAVASASASYGILESSVPDRKEQWPDTWVDACFSVLKTVLKAVPDPSLVRALSVSGQQHGLVVVGETGEVLRPAKLWCDLESAAEADQLSEQLGWKMVPGFTASKLLWLKNHEPHHFQSAKKVMLPHDYINFVLTGVHAMECGDASGTGFLTAERTWDTEAMRAVDPIVPDLFPPLLGPNEPVGTLLPNVAETLGLGEEVVVAAGSGDNMMSALGAGAVAEGVSVLSLGTSGTIFGCSSSRLFDASGAVAPFCDATGNWLPLLCTMSCSGVLQDVRDSYGLSHSELTDLAAAETPGCQGVNFLPYLNGERTPNWPRASGTILGIRPGYMRPGLIYRAAMEGATYTLLAGLKKMQSMGFKPSELRVVGGGSKNKLWRRIIADAFQLSLRFPKEPESAALGAALQAGAVFSKIDIKEYVQQQGVALETEVIEPNPELKDLYDAAFAKHYQLGNLLFDSQV